MSLYKITVLGMGGVGKTAVTIRLCSNHFVEYYDPTIENSYRRQVVIDGEAALLDILDTAGQEEYSALRAQWIRSGEGFVLMYSIDKTSSFEELSIYHKLILDAKDATVEDAPPMVLVANKVDLDKDGLRKVSTEEGQQMATKLNALFFESSAKEMINVEEAFIALVRLIRTKAKAAAEASATENNKGSASSSSSSSSSGGKEGGGGGAQLFNNARRASLNKIKKGINKVKTNERCVLC